MNSKHFLLQATIRVYKYVKFILHQKIYHTVPQEFWAVFEFLPANNILKTVRMPAWFPIEASNWQDFKQL